jgi:hypothetical protein
MATTSESLTAAQPPGRTVRRVVSALVVFHLLAVFIGPWAMPPQTSELAGSMAQVFQPYVETLSLANGYRFFAPEPGPSHLVRYEITLDDGSRVAGVFPDRQRHQPRLLYHRYFMLSEFANTLTNPEAPSDRAKAFARGIAEHLADEYHAPSVKLFLRKHYVPRMHEVREGRRLTDEKLYVEIPLYTFVSEDSRDGDGR